MEIIIKCWWLLHIKMAKLVRDIESLDVKADTTIDPWKD